MRAPDFFIAGHQKCGTTALYYMLKEHPRIFMSEVKEPRYFATDMRTRFPVRSPEALVTLKDRHHPGDRVRLSWVDTAGATHTAAIRLANGPPD